MTAPTWSNAPLTDLRAELREASGRHIAVVTLDLPQRRNSMSTPMTESWVRLMGLLATDEALAAVVVTGAPPAFSAGGDLSWIVKDRDASVPQLRERMLVFYRSWLSVRDLPVPTIRSTP